ncbi:N-methyl-L-tryptophan oxidase [Aeoliella sp. SH292]|uniref:N-methyl-L-tryptophan oxidase n=1 Tax=Aeoliella sp. SH292 TaxID=3454464 RepID=UPI003F9903C5
MTTSFDVIVIGAGGVGSAAMRELARRGAKVLGIDRFAPPHPHGSTHGETRVIRQAYFEHSDYVPLLRRAYEHWNEVEQTSGLTLFERCGLLEVGPPDGEVVAGVLSAARLHGLDVEQLNVDEVSRRWPALRIPEGLAAVFEPTAGCLHVERCVEAMLADARRLGAELVTNCEVRSWRSVGDSFEVVTSDATYSAAKLVVTAGAWAAGLLGELGVPLTPVRKSLFWFPVSSMQRPAELPVYLYELDYGVHYGFPSLDGQTFKVAEHTGGVEVADPLSVDPTTDPEELLATQRFARECLVGAGEVPTSHKTCLYTMSPDGHFIVDCHPQFPGVAFAAGLSGHGYKFAPVLGEALADLALNGETKLPIGFLSANRFQQS